MQKKEAPWGGKASMSTSSPLSGEDSAQKQDIKGSGI
jgi:hypothetical protein